MGVSMDSSSVISIASLTISVGGICEAFRPSWVARLMTCPMHDMLGYEVDKLSKVLIKTLNVEDDATRHALVHCAKGSCGPIPQDQTALIGIANSSIRVLPRILMKKIKLVAHSNIKRNLDR